MGRCASTRQAACRHPPRQPRRGGDVCSPARWLHEMRCHSCAVRLKLGEWAVGGVGLGFWGGGRSGVTPIGGPLGRSVLAFDCFSFPTAFSSSSPHNHVSLRLPVCVPAGACDCVVPGEAGRAGCVGRWRHCFDRLKERCQRLLPAFSNRWPPSLRNAPPPLLPRRPALRVGSAAPSTARVGTSTSAVSARRL